MAHRTGQQQFPPAAGMNVEREEFQPQERGVKGIGLHRQTRSAKKQQQKNKMTVLILIQMWQVNFWQLKGSGGVSRSAGTPRLIARPCPALHMCCIFHKLKAGPATGTVVTAALLGQEQARSISTRCL